MILLEPLPEPDLQAYLAETIPAYADDKVKAGNWLAEEALERSRQSFEQLLPAGAKSPGQYLYNIVDTAQGVTVGMLWFGLLSDTPPTLLRSFMSCIFLRSTSAEVLENKPCWLWRGK